MKRFILLSLVLTGLSSTVFARTNPYWRPQIRPKYSDDKNWPVWGDDYIDFLKEILDEFKAEAKDGQEVPKAPRPIKAEEASDQAWTDQFVLDVLRVIAEKESPAEAEQRILGEVEATQNEVDDDPPPKPAKP